MPPPTGGCRCPVPDSGGPSGPDSSIGAHVRGPSLQRAGDLCACLGVWTGSGCHQDRGEGEGDDDPGLGSYQLPKELPAPWLRSLQFLAPGDAPLNRRVHTPPPKS